MEETHLLDSVAQRRRCNSFPEILKAARGGSKAECCACVTPEESHVQNAD